MDDDNNNNNDNVVGFNPKVINNPNGAEQAQDPTLSHLMNSEVHKYTICLMNGHSVVVEGVLFAGGENYLILTTGLDILFCAPAANVAYLMPVKED